MARKLVLARRWYAGALAAAVSSLVLLSVFSPHVVQAAAGTALTTSPISVSLAAKPGTSVSTDLQVQNNSPNTVMLAVHLQEFRAAGDNGQAQIYVPPTGDPALSWVHFSEDTFTAVPGVWHKVTMTINLPKTAAFGYYYAVVFSPAASGAPVPGVSTYKGANAILVLLNAQAPGEKNVLDIAGFSADQHAYQYLPATFSVNVRNVGDIYTAPRGNIYISRTPNGTVIDSIDINKGLGNVLPGTNRVYTATWDDGFPVYQAKRVNGQIVSDKQGRPVKELSWDWTRLNRIRFGRYYARLVLVYNDGTRDVPLYETVSFWVVPWAPLLVLLAIAALILLGLWSIVLMIIRRRRPWRAR